MYLSFVHCFICLVVLSLLTEHLRDCHRFVIKAAYSLSDKNHKLNQRPVMMFHLLLSVWNMAGSGLKYTKSHYTNELRYADATLTTM